MLAVVKWLEGAGLGRAAAAAAVRLQMCPAVTLNVLGEKVRVADRAVGWLIGSRTAGALGRVPVEHCLRERVSSWRSHGLPLDIGVPLAVFTFVGNLYAVSTSAAGAVHILADAERVFYSANGVCAQSPAAVRSCGPPARRVSGPPSAPVPLATCGVAFPFCRR